MQLNSTSKSMRNMNRLKAAQLDVVCFFFLFFLLCSLLRGSLSGVFKSAATSANCFTKINANRFQTALCICLLLGYTFEDSSFVLDKSVSLSAFLFFPVTFTVVWQFFKAEIEPF